MKKLILVLIICLGWNVNAQQSEKEDVKATIIKFFDAFHKQDTTALKAMVKGDIKLQTISVNKTGQTVLRENDYSNFVKGIASIPQENSFEEKL